MEKQSVNKQRNMDGMTPQFHAALIKELRSELEKAKAAVDFTIAQAAKAKDEYAAARQEWFAMLASPAAALTEPGTGRFGDQTVVRANLRFQRAGQACGFWRDAITDARTHVRDTEMRLARCEAGIGEATAVVIAAWGRHDDFAWYLNPPRDGEPTVEEIQEAARREGISLFGAIGDGFRTARNMWIDGGRR